MKVAFVKQVLDVGGPWASIRWEETTPEGLFKFWPGKASLWEATCLLKVDWYVIPQQFNTEYTKDAVLKHPGRFELVMNNVSNVVQVKDIPFERYDIVISSDPILDIPKFQRTVFAYHMAEHWERLYKESLKKPMGNYDLFLAHMLDAPQTVNYLPQAISFPYLRDPDTMRSVFYEDNKQESVWIDWRTFKALGLIDVEHSVVDTAAREIEQQIGISVSYKSDYLNIPYGISDPPRWADAAIYLRELSRSKYYVSVGRDSGAGQGLCDAASIGCICIGEQNKPFHRIVCHPACLCADMGEMLQRLKRIIQSPQLQEDVCAWQDGQLREYFIKKPLSLLKDVLDRKVEMSLTFNKKSSHQAVDVSPKSKSERQQSDRANPEPFTIFALPKPFTDEFALIQENAIKSWTLLNPKPEIILFGDDEGVAEIADKFGLKHIPDVEQNEFGTPLLNGLFKKAQAAASNDILMYINSDIILLDDFVPAVHQCADNFNEFLMVGQRWDADVSKKVDFSDVDWRKKLRDFVIKNGYLHAPTGVDYFVFTRNLWGQIPPFALARTMWDNWLVGKPIENGKVVVDATEVVMVVHQNHRYVRSAAKSEEEELNRRLSGGCTGLTSHAPWKLTSGGLILRHVGEILRGSDFPAVLKRIDKLYKYDRDRVQAQFEHWVSCARHDHLAKLSVAARAELMSGSATNAAKLVLGYTNASNQISAAEQFRKGFECLRDGNVVEALKYFDKAAIDFAGLPNLHFAIATAYAQLGDLSSARKACRIELSLQPENDGAKGLLERINQAISEYEESIAT